MITVTNELTVDCDSAELVGGFISFIETYDEGGVYITDGAGHIPGIWICYIKGRTVKEVKKATKWVLSIGKQNGLKVSE
jgi:hypothetical protein